LSVVQLSCGSLGVARLQGRTRALSLPAQQTKPHDHAGRVLLPPAGDDRRVRHPDRAGYVPYERQRGIGQQLRVRAHLRRLFSRSLEATRERVGRSEEHTSELQSPDHLVCRLLLEKKKETN